MENTDLIYGLHAVTEALNGDLVNKLYVQEDLRGKNVEKIKELARLKKVNISWTPKTELNKLTENGVHQGFMARVSEFAYADLEKILPALAEKSDATILILDELTDQSSSIHNLGSIARTADATGVDAIIIPKHRAVGITSTAVKASTGALQHVPIVRVTNLSQTLDKLKAANFWVFGTDMDGTVYSKWNTKGKVALIIGNEGHGIGQNLKKQVDEMITIPMTGHVQSLNASVAASILMYEIFRNRL